MGELRRGPGFRARAAVRRLVEEIRALREQVDRLESERDVERNPVAEIGPRH